MLWMGILCRRWSKQSFSSTTPTCSPNGAPSASVLTMVTSMTTTSWLVQLDDSAGYKISGILDFGGMRNGYYIHELAITIMYMMIENPTPLDVLTSWESVIPLNEAERDSLYLLVLCRFCQSLVCSPHCDSTAGERRIPYDHGQDGHPPSLPALGNGQGESGEALV